jgi:hypothetical protein
VRHNHAYGLRHDREAALSERRFTRLASSSRSTARNSARPRAMTNSGCAPTRSVHWGGTDHTVAPSSCSKRRSPYRLYRLPTQGSCRPNNGWNGCVTRTNCSDGLGESAFSVEVQAAGEGTLHLAGDKGGHSYAHPSSVIHAVGRFGVAGSTTDMGANAGGIVDIAWMRRLDSEQDCPRSR